MHTRINHTHRTAPLWGALIAAASDPAKDSRADLTPPLTLLTHANHTQTAAPLWGALIAAASYPAKIPRVDLAGALDDAFTMGLVSNGILSVPKVFESRRL